MCPRKGMLFLETVSLGYIEKLLLCGHRGACLPMEERRKHNFCEVISKHFKFQIHVAAVEVNIFLLLFSNTVVSQVPGSFNLIVFFNYAFVYRKNSHNTYYGLSSDRKSISVFTKPSGSTVIKLMPHTHGEVKGRLGASIGWGWGKKSCIYSSILLSKGWMLPPRDFKLCVGLVWFLAESMWVIYFTITFVTFPARIL